MELLPVHDLGNDSRAIARAASLLRSGGLVAFPTETVYGLGANALDRRAVERIYEAKGRPDYNPLIVHVLDENAARDLSSDWTALASTLARHFWPGPLTLVVRKDDAIPENVTAGLDTVALRSPAHPVARALLEASAVPLAAPSANRSTGLSPTRAEHVARSLGQRVDLILDGGATPVGIESTVVDATGTEAIVLRPGSISLEELRAVVPARALSDRTGEKRARPSPGMLDRHYAPRAELWLYESAAAARRFVLDHGGRRVAIVRMEGEDVTGTEPADMPADPSQYAAVLYDVLHRLDAEGFDAILVQLPPDDGAWAAIHDRLSRAAAGRLPGA
jgi:L-threonylcarbamoyladenylate synthase